MATVTPAGRSLSETISVVQTVVWALFTAFVAGLLVLSVAGFVLAAADPIPLLVVLGAAVGGTVALGVADVVFG